METNGALPMYCRYQFISFVASNTSNFVSSFNMLSKYFNMLSICFNISGNSHIAEISCIRFLHQTPLTLIVSSFIICSAPLVESLTNQNTLNISCRWQITRLLKKLIKMASKLFITGLGLFTISKLILNNRIFDILFLNTIVTVVSSKRSSLIHPYQ